MMSMSNLSKLQPNTVLEPTGVGAGSSTSESTSQPAGGSFEVLIYCLRIEPEVRLPRPANVTYQAG